MVTKKQREMAQKRYNAFLQYATAKRFSNDIEYLTIAELNVKYHAKFKNKKSLMGTVRRMENYLQIPIQNQRRDSYKGATVGELKNAFELKFGKRGVSYQQVNLVVNYDLYCQKKGGVLISKNQWITFSGGISKTVFSLKTMLGIAIDKYDAWLDSLKSADTNCEAIINSKETRIYRWVK